MFCGWGEGRGSGGLREKEAASIRSSPESPPKGVLRLEWGHPLPVSGAGALEPRATPSGKARAPFHKPRRVRIGRAWRRWHSRLQLAGLGILYLLCSHAQEGHMSARGLGLGVVLPGEGPWLGRGMLPRANPAPAQAPPPERVPLISTPRAASPRPCCPAP